MDSKELITLLQNELAISLPANADMEKLRSALAVYCNELIEKDFQHLVNLLYRLDVNENRLKQLLKDNSDTDAGLIIADLMIERQLQKMEARKQFKRREGEIDEEEKW